MRKNRRTAWSMIFLMLATSFPSEVNMENVYANTNYVEDNIEEEQKQDAENEIETGVATGSGISGTAVTGSVVTEDSIGTNDTAEVPKGSQLPVTEKPLISTQPNLTKTVEPTATATTTIDTKEGDLATLTPTMLPEETEVSEVTEVPAVTEVPTVTEIPEETNLPGTETISSSTPAITQKTPVPGGVTKVPVTNTSEPTEVPENGTPTPTTDSAVTTFCPTATPSGGDKTENEATLPPISNLTTPTPNITNTPTTAPTVTPTPKAGGSSVKVTEPPKEEEITVCEVTYVLKGGKNHNLNPSKLLDKNVSISLFSPKKSGYQFEGWYLESAYQNKVTEITNTGQKKITLYAKWKKIVVKKAKIVSARSISSTKIEVKVKKIELIKGYEYVYSFSPSFSKKYRVRTTKNPKVLHKLKGGKECYIMVRAYRTDSYGRKIYGKYSKVVKRKLKD